MTEDHKAILYTLKLALLEIRISSNHEGAKILADIFHNVPSQVANGKEPAAIMSEVKEKADRHHRTAHIAGLFRVRSPLLGEMLQNSRVSRR